MLNTVNIFIEILTVMTAHQVILCLYRIFMDSFMSFFSNSPKSFKVFGYSA